MERLCLALCHPPLIKKSRLWPTHRSVSLFSSFYNDRRVFFTQTIIIICRRYRHGNLIPVLSVYRVASETASMSSRSHPRNTSTSCVQASQKRSCSTAWSLSECLSPATLSGKSFQLLLHFTNCCPYVGNPRLIHKE